VAGKPKYDYPDRDELVRLLRELGGQYQVAQALGIPRPTLQHHLTKLGIQRDEYLPAKTLVAKVPDGASGDAEVSREEILEQRVKELESQVRRDRKVEVMDERIAQAIEASAAVSLPVYNAARPTRRAATKRSKAAEHEFVLLWSDTHAGEVVSAEETNGLNRYNWDIMWKRQERMREAVLSYRENRPYQVDRLHVLALGDMLSGNIHDELEATNEMPFAQATIDFAVEGASWLASFGESFDSIRFSGVVGNHPRAHRKPRAKHSFDNGDWLVYSAMKQLLAGNDQVVFDVPKSSQHLVEVCGRQILLFHGDSVRSSMPGVPWGGVMRRVNSLNATYGADGRPIDMFTCGHFHSAAFVQSDAGQIVMNGSVKGVDEYSLKAFGGGRPPQQLLLTFHPRYGLTDMSLLDLDDPADSA